MKPYLARWIDSSDGNEIVRQTLKAVSVVHAGLYAIHRACWNQRRTQTVFKLSSARSIWAPRLCGLPSWNRLHCLLGDINAVQTDDQSDWPTFSKFSHPYLLFKFRHHIGPMRYCVFKAHCYFKGMVPPCRLSRLPAFRSNTIGLFLIECDSLPYGTNVKQDWDSWRRLA